MTNEEEAVKIIKRERDSMRRLVDDCNLPITGGNKYIEAYDMAIEALEKQISKKPEDLNLPEKMEKQDYEFCLRCGRKLKNPIAREKGYGAVCEKKMRVEKSRRLFADNREKEKPP